MTIRWGAIGPGRLVARRQAREDAIRQQLMDDWRAACLLLRAGEQDCLTDAGRLPCQTERELIIRGPEPRKALPD